MSSETPAKPTPYANSANPSYFDLSQDQIDEIIDDKEWKSKWTKDQKEANNHQLTYWFIAEHTKGKIIMSPMKTWACYGQFQQAGTLHAGSIDGGATWKGHILNINMPTRMDAAEYGTNHERLLESAREWYALLLDPKRSKWPGMALRCTPRYDSDGNLLYIAFRDENVLPVYCVNFMIACRIPFLQTAHTTYEIFKTWITFRDMDVDPWEAMLLSAWVRFKYKRGQVLSVPKEREHSLYRVLHQGSHFLSSISSPESPGPTYQSFVSPRRWLSVEPNFENYKRTSWSSSNGIPNNVIWQDTLTAYDKALVPSRSMISTNGKEPMRETKRKIFGIETTEHANTSPTFIYHRLLDRMHDLAKSEDGKSSVLFNSSGELL